MLQGRQAQQHGPCHRAYVSVEEAVGHGQPSELGEVLHGGVGVPSRWGFLQLAEAKPRTGTPGHRWR